MRADNPLGMLLHHVAMSLATFSVVMELPVLILYASNLIETSTSAYTILRSMQVSSVG